MTTYVFGDVQNSRKPRYCCFLNILTSSRKFFNSSDSLTLCLSKTRQATDFVESESGFEEIVVLELTVSRGPVFIKQTFLSPEEIKPAFGGGFNLLLLL